MLRLFSRGRRAPHDYPSVLPSSAVRLHRAKFDAWHIAIGANRHPADRSDRQRRQHRGMLDDLPMPETPELAPLPTIGIFVEMVGRLLGFSPAGSAGSAALAGESETPVGEFASVTYIGNSDAEESRVPMPVCEDQRNSESRAA
jgi:hypothetical protein